MRGARAQRHARQRLQKRGRHIMQETLNPKPVNPKPDLVKPCLHCASVRVETPKPRNPKTLKEQQPGKRSSTKSLQEGAVDKVLILEYDGTVNIIRPFRCCRLLLLPGPTDSTSLLGDRSADGDDADDDCAVTVATIQSKCDDDCPFTVTTILRNDSSAFSILYHDA